MKKVSKKISQGIKLVNQIQNIRSKNNKNWMDLLRIALKYSPKKSSIVLKKININDKKISALFDELSKK